MEEFSLEESAIERKIYQLIYEYDLSYTQMKKVFEVIDNKLEYHLQNRVFSPNKKPFDLTRGQKTSG